MEVTVDVINKGAMPLLSGMEQLQLIRLHLPFTSKKLAPQKLSQKFAGALHLSNKQYEAFQSSLKNSKDEWERNI
ncbi:hypothetical protein AGMMS4956_12340 [Bacteroidia bacterium]|nr:hypothetical protein AGMMS4956_12340 [Bacteroidia bacterium]